MRYETGKPYHRAMNIVSSSIGFDKNNCPAFVIQMSMILCLLGLIMPKIHI